MYKDKVNTWTYFGCVNKTEKKLKLKLKIIILLKDAQGLNSFKNWLWMCEQNWEEVKIENILDDCPQDDSKKVTGQLLKYIVMFCINRSIFYFKKLYNI